MEADVYWCHIVAGHVWGLWAKVYPGVGAGLSFRLWISLIFMCMVLGGVWFTPVLPAP